MTTTSPPGAPGGAGPLSPATPVAPETTPPASAWAKMQALLAQDVEEMPSFLAVSTPPRTRSMVLREAGVDRPAVLAIPGRTVGLVMMVKNEASSLRETLQSVRGQVDAWLILDTGSTDGSQAIAQEVLGHLPGRVVEGPFVDFSTSRNLMLDLADELGCPFLLMLNGEDTLVVDQGHDLRRTVAAQLARHGVRERDPSEGAYHLLVLADGVRFHYPRLIRTASRWRFVGATHEVLIPADGSGPHPHHFVHGVTIRQERRDPSGLPRRWALDVELLQADLAKNPSNDRAVFYLALTLDAMGDRLAALSFYEKRLTMGGWPEVLCVCHLRVGRIGLALVAEEASQGDVTPAMGSAHEARTLAAEHQFALAHERSPQRAEPLIDLGRSLAMRGLLHSASVLLRAGIECAMVPLPPDALLVETAYYEGGKGHAGYHLVLTAITRSLTLREAALLPEAQRVAVCRYCAAAPPAT